MVAGSTVNIFIHLLSAAYLDLDLGGSSLNRYA